MMLKKLISVLVVASMMVFAFPVGGAPVSAQVSDSYVQGQPSTGDVQADEIISETNATIYTKIAEAQENAEGLKGQELTLLIKTLQDECEELTHASIAQINKLGVTNVGIEYVKVKIGGRTVKVDPIKVF